MDATAILIMMLLSIMCVLMTALVTVCIVVALKLSTSGAGTQQSLVKIEDKEITPELLAWQQRTAQQFANMMAYNGTPTNQKSLKEGDD